MSQKKKDNRIKNARVQFTESRDTNLIKPIFNSIYDILNPQQDPSIQPAGKQRKEFSENGNDREDP